MGEIVGRHGAVVGIDVSTDLITQCNRRKTSAWLLYAIGDATRVDHADASFDVAVCTQVAEYVPDVDLVLAEAFRVMKPGGRAIFIATDWDAVVWHSENPERMALVMKSWEAHCAHQHLQWGDYDQGRFKAFAIGSKQQCRATVVLTNGFQGMAIMPELIGRSLTGPHPAFAWLGYPVLRDG